ncbi:MAG: hypothetical protein E6J53_06105, partial [Chloroflexi bacterium]
MDALRARRPGGGADWREARRRSPHGWIRRRPSHRRALPERDRLDGRPGHRPSCGGNSRDRRSGSAPVLNRSVYELAGGEQAFRLLVRRFYERVGADPVLRAVYPEEDLSGATERLTLFLIQYWGGPPIYSEQRGHPRLRLRHQP